MTLGRLALNIYRTWGKKPKRTAGSWLAPLPWALLNEGRCALRVDSPALYLCCPWATTPAGVVVHLGRMDPRGCVDPGSELEVILAGNSGDVGTWTVVLG